MTRAMRVLVTGGAGFIGSHLSDDLIGAGYEVAVLDDLSTGRRENLPKSARFYEVDIRDEQAVARVFADFRPNVVSHQAAQTSVAISTRRPAEDAAINVVGGIHVLRAAEEHGIFEHELQLVRLRQRI